MRLIRYLQRFAVVAASLAIFHASGAAATPPTVTLPSMRFLSAPLVSPSSALTTYGTGTTHSSSFTGVTGFSGQPPEIVELTRALKNDPDLIFEYVRNHIDTEFAFGLRKGAVGTLVDKSGTPFDQTVLFVTLVRQAGYTARYHVGRVTLNAADFTAWTGVSNMQAACRLLASGGIPAAFNGQSSSASDCSLSGTFTSVTMLHPWADVQIGGTWYAFDPSVKALTSNAGIDLASASGFTSGSAATAAAATTDSGTQSGASFLHNASLSGLGSYLLSRGTQLLNYLKANAPSSDVESVIGRDKIVPLYKPVGGWRNTTLSGYVADRTITGDYPDQYRTKLQVTFYANDTNALNRTLYTDETYGRRLEVTTNFDSATDSSTGPYAPLTWNLTLDGVSLQTFVCGSGGSSANCLPAPTVAPSNNHGFITLAIDHPYVANSSAYGDQTVTKDVQVTIQFAIIVGFGRTSPSLLAKWSGEMADDKALPSPQPPFHCPGAPPEDMCSGTYAQATGDAARQRLVANWLSQQSAMLTLQGEIGGSLIDQQHVLGIVSWRYDLGFAWPHPDIPGSPSYLSIADQYTELNVDSSLTVTSKTTDLAKVAAVSRSVALASATLEGSILEQMEDLPDAASTASRFAWGNSPDDEDPCFTSSNPRRFYDFTGTTATTRSGLYQFEGSASGCGAAPTIVSAPAATWKSLVESPINTYLANSFHVTASAETFLGPGSRYGVSIEGDIANQNLPSRQRGGALIATQYDGAGTVLQVAHVLTTLDGVSKGGGGHQPERFSEYDPKKAADALKDRFVDRSTALGVDLRSGNVSYSSPTLLSVGAGDAPYSLDYQLSYKAGPTGCTPQFGPCTGPIQGGWSQNWDFRLALSGSGLEAMGARSPQSAAGTIVAFMAMQDIFSQAGRTDLEKDVYASLVADWWRRQMVGNVVTITRGAAGQQYVRQVDDSWLAPVGAPGVLTQTGVRTKQRGCAPSGGDVGYHSTSRRWEQSSVAFSLRNAGGDVLGFSPWSWHFDTEARCGWAYGFKPTSWTFAQGPSLTFTYDYVKGVTGVTSSLGRTLTFDSASDGFGGNLLTASDGTYTVGQIGSGIKDASGATWNYDYTPIQIRSASQRPIPYPELVRVYEPVAPTKPSLEFIYDSQGRAKAASDATALRWKTRGAYSFYIADSGRSERVDPAGGIYTVYFDTDGYAVRHLDELGRENDAVFDGLGRVTKRTYPEGDIDEFAYDARDNVVSLTRKPKPGSPEAAITVTAAYDATWNKLLWVKDPVGQQTDFTYYATGAGASLLATVTRPDPDGAGSAPRPVYSYAYNSLGLLTQQVDPTGVTTSFTYDTAGNLLTKTIGAAAANGGAALNLTTTYVPNARGDQVSTTSARGILTTFQYDAMRRVIAEQDYSGGGGSALLAAQTVSYDANGRVSGTQRASGFGAGGAWLGSTTTSTSYTPSGRVWRTTDQDGRIAETHYDALDRPLRTVGPSGLVIGFEYDLAGQRTKEFRGISSPVNQVYATYGYTPNGQLAWVRDANSNESDYVYDGFNRLTKIIYPNPSSGAPNATDFEQRTYDALDNVIALRTRAGIVLSTTYDGLSRVVTKAIPATASSPAKTVTYTYDSAGRTTGTSDTLGNSQTATFDAAGRDATASSAGPQWSGTKTISYQYDGDSNRTRLTWPDGYYASYSYDGLGRMTAVSENGATTLDTITYDALSRRTADTMPGASVSRTFSPAGDLLTVSNSWTSSPSSGTSAVWTNAYDGAHRVTSETLSNASFSWTGSAPGSQVFTPDRLNRYSSIGGVAQSYDTGGNLSGDGIWTFAYDGENKLVSAVKSGSTIAYGYDPMGRRTFKTVNGVTTAYLSAGGDEIAEYGAGGTLTRRYIPGPSTDDPVAQVDAAGAHGYYVRDRNGSTVGLVNDAGQLIEGPYSYDSYGTPNNVAGTPFRFVGRRFDSETGLYYFRARYYSSGSGRFLQTDKVGYRAGMHLYAYVSNDPVNAADSSGFDCDETTFCATSIPNSWPGAQQGYSTITMRSGTTNQAPPAETAPRAKGLLPAVPLENQPSIPQGTLQQTARHLDDFAHTLNSGKEIRSLIFQNRADPTITASGTIYRQPKEQLIDAVDLPPESTSEYSPAEWKIIGDWHWHPDPNSSFFSNKDYAAYDYGRRNYDPQFTSFLSSKGGPLIQMADPAIVRTVTGSAGYEGVPVPK